MQLDHSVGPRGVIVIESDRICQHIHMTAAVDTPRTRRKEQFNQEVGLWHDLYFPSLSLSYFFYCTCISRVPNSFL